MDIAAGAGEALTRGADARGAIRFVPGGSAANVAVWMARLGADAACIGAVGADPWGVWLADDLRREGVRHLGPTRGRTAAILAFVDAAGERTFVTDRAAALDLRPTDLPAGWCAGLNVLHVPAYSLFAGSLAQTTRGAIAAARAANAAISVDLSSASLLRAYGSARFAALLYDLRPDYLFANEDEARVVWPAASSDDLAAAMRAVAGVAILKRGARGILVAAVDECIAAAAPARAVVDSTGAGDALAAALFITHLRTEDLWRAAWEAVRLAGAVVQARGARPQIAGSGQ